MNEAQIVQRCREGDRQAQHALYMLTSDRVYGLLLKMTHNADDAFDLAQETYLRVFRNIHQFDGRCGIMTWVHRIALNEGLQFLRRKKLHPRAVPEVDEEASSDSGITATDARLDIEQALAQLSESDRSLIVLRHMQGLTYAQMEEVLEKPPGTIASGLNRARQALRELLEPPEVRKT